MKNRSAPQVAKYLARSCPKCAGYFGVIVSRLPYRSSIRAVSGWCKRCNYKIAWALVVKEKDALGRSKSAVTGLTEIDRLADKEAANVDQFFVGTKKI